MLFNGGLIPTCLLVVGSLGLLNTLGSLILPGALPIFSMILMMNFFRGVPKELEESAFIDGASHWQVLWHIYIPLSLPAIATLTLLSAVNHWNAWFDALIYMTDVSNYPMQTYLRTIVVELDLDQCGHRPARFAAAIRPGNPRRADHRGDRAHPGCLSLPAALFHLRHQAGRGEGVNVSLSEICPRPKSLPQSLLRASQNEGGTSKHASSPSLFMGEGAGGWGSP